MTKIINNNLIASVVIGLAVFALAPVAFAGDAPIVETLGATEITADSATLNVYFSSRDASYELWNHMPTVTVSWGTTRDLDRFTESREVTVGSRTEEFMIDGLESEEEYWYRAVMYYDGEIVKGEKLSFKTLPERNAGLDNNPLVGSEPNVVPQNELFGFSQGGVVESNNQTTTDTDTENDGDDFSPTGGSSTDYLFIEIENGEDEVYQNDIVTYKIDYRNFSERELEDATLIIDIPEEFRVMSISGARRITESDGEVVARLGDIKAGEEDTIKVTGRLQKPSADDVTIARADIIYTVGKTGPEETATDFDIDEYHGRMLGAGVLGASVIGSGFLPASIFGWILLILLIGVIAAIVRRVYMRPVPNETRYPQNA